MVDLFDDGGGLQIRHKQIPNVEKTVEEL